MRPSYAGFFHEVLRVARAGRDAARGGKQAKNKSVVAVARKLAVLLHHIWTTQQPYVPFYQQAA